VTGGLSAWLSLKPKSNPLVCTDKGRVLYRNASGVSVGIQSLRRDWNVSANCAGLSKSSCVACVQEVVCGRWTRLLRCDREIVVDCSLATCSGVALTVPKAACCQSYQAARDLVCAGAVSSCWGGSWGVVWKYAPKQHLTHDFQLMTCVSSSGWLPLYTLPTYHCAQVIAPPTTMPSSNSVSLSETMPFLFTAKACFCILLST